MSIVRQWFVCAWVALAACAAPARPPASNVARAVAPDGPAAESSSDRFARVSAEPWSEASESFRAQPNWLGADSAYSIDLDATHVLWLFADTFIDPAADGSRENGPNFFIRNSVAVQTGDDAESSHDLSRSQLKFFWGPKRANVPSSFFQDVDSSEEWLWPLHGARLSDGRLLMFRMHVVKQSGGLGFRVDGWDAVAIDEPLASPDTWKPRVLTQKLSTFGKLVGSSVLVHGEFVYAYAVNNQDQDHAIYLARWPRRQLAGLKADALADPQWWTQTGFVSESAIRDVSELKAIWSDGQVELSVHFDASAQRFVEIQMQGLFVGEANTQIGLRTAEHPEGPWSALTPFFRPTESTLPNAPDLAAYAAKAHPEQRGADLVLSYVVNDLKRFPPGDRVYYPQIVRVRE